MERKWRSEKLFNSKGSPEFGSDTAGLNVFNAVAAGVAAFGALAHHDSAERS